MFNQKVEIDTKPLEAEAGIKAKDIIAKKEKVCEKSKPFKFNTFSGVFVPSVLAILGAVMYLIMPRVLGGVGLLSMLFIILIAHSLSTATAFSLSGITTNIKIKGGGLYYLISRSLGSEFGGALGIQLFLAQAVSIGFYTIAFSKGLSILFSYFNIILPEVYVALVSCLLFAILAYKGADYVIKVQFAILGVIVLSLVSIFIGPNVAANPVTMDIVQIPFWIAFAMFFPAVVGIDAGVGMSGDLKEPKKSLVKGTFMAILFTFIIYVLLALKLSSAAPLNQLFNDPFIIGSVSFVPGLVIAGILLATSSSALSYLLTSPRTLRALANDNIFPGRLKFLASSIGDSKEPRVALVVSIIIAITVIFSGGLDFVSQLVTVFFLNVYGWINAAAFFEKISKNPSYRPSFNSPAIISFYGMIISYFVMYLFNPWIMVFSILFQITIFYILTKTKSSVKLESVWDGVLFQFLRGTISKIEKTAKSKKNWRPTVVGFCADDTNRNIMFSLLDWIGAHSGIVKFYFLMPGNIEISTKQREIVEEDMKQHIKENNQDIFPRVIETEDFRLAVESTLQSETIGNLPPNTMFIHFDDRFQIDKLAKLTKRLKKNVIILKNNSGFSDFKFIDVWWDDPDNGNLMIMLAYLISHARTWMEKEASIRLFKVVKNDKDYEFFDNKLNKLISDSRIDNISVKIIKEKKKKMHQIIKQNSHYADLVLMGLPHAKEGINKDTLKEIKKYTDGLTTSLVVLANDKIDFRIN